MHCFIFSVLCKYILFSVVTFKKRLRISPFTRYTRSIKCTRDTYQTPKHYAVYFVYKNSLHKRLAIYGSLNSYIPQRKFL